MNKLVINIEPFLLMQKVYSYNDNGVNKEIEMPTADLDTALFQLIEDNNIEELSIAGSKNYTQKIKENILEKELTKYGINKINIKLI